MADHGWKYEHARRWQLMFGCSQDSVEWNIRDLCKPFLQERLTITRNETTIRASMSTDSVFQGHDRELFRATFGPGASGCEEIYVEGERVERAKRSR